MMTYFMKTLFFVFSLFLCMSCDSDIEVPPTSNTPFIDLQDQGMQPIRMCTLVGSLLENSRQSTTDTPVIHFTDPGFIYLFG